MRSSCMDSVCRRCESRLGGFCVPSTENRCSIFSSERGSFARRSLCADPFNKNFIGSILNLPSVIGN